ncbi:copper resistance protein CopC [Gemmatimonas sp.]|jgi:methionine-rich copper-binding protein CopC|uniref:copper resistance protein CopC n=1 Tax=Gemmatimonas sp. TaxID=1962908 RepID=UPI0037BE6DCF
MTRSTRRLLPLVVAMCVVPAAATAARLPHLKLKAMFPGKDTTLVSSPDAVKLWLSEPADLPATKVAIADAAGTAVPVAKLTRGAQSADPVVAKFTSPLASGKYTVTWKAMSKDGHVVSGVYSFTVALPK